MYEEISIWDYLNSIKYNKFASAEIIVTACHELSKLRKLRDLSEQNKKVEKYIFNNKDQPFDKTILEIDRLNNEIIKQFNFEGDNGINIFESMEKNIEETAFNPPEDFWKGPFNTINRIFGSITIPSNITLIGARTGANKTNLALFYGLHLATTYSLPIIYMDYGELNLRAIQSRCAAMLIKNVPYHTIVRGTWIKNPEYVKQVRKIWEKIRKLKLIYYDVGNLFPNDILSLIRRSYYSQIGRGNPCLLIYDYLKPFDYHPHQEDWKMMANFSKNLKTMINNEIPIPAWMSIQMNRKGITNNRKSISVDDSEDSLQVDRVLHNASLGFLLRMKTTDELLDENNEFGNIKMIPVKHREILGDDFFAAFKPVRMPDGSYRKNYINLKMENFSFVDMGDLNQMVAKLSNQIKLDNHNHNDDINI